MDFFYRTEKVFFDRDNEDLEIQLVDFLDGDVEPIDDIFTYQFSKQYVIKCFGITKTGNSIYVKINGFKPYFYIEVPKSWSQTNTRSLEYHLKNKDTKYKNWKGEDKSTRYWTKGLECRIVSAIKFYGYQHSEQSRFVKIILQSKQAFSIISRYFANNTVTIGPFQNQKFKLYESNLQPLLRFFHHRNISPSGWIRLPKKKYE